MNDWGFNANSSNISAIRLTHNNKERSECIPYNSKYLLKHVLIDCVDVANVRQNFYNINTLYDVFTNGAGDTILKFLKEILPVMTVRTGSFANYGLYFV
jgi:hypothetical protein